jgi:hypothetical protein
MSAMPLTAIGMAETFLFQKLAGDSQVMAAVTGIYATLAPEGSQPPYLVFVCLGGTDTTALGPFRTLSRLQYAVKGINKVGSLAALDALMARVDTLLMGAAMAFSPGNVLECTRQGQMSLGDPDAGVAFRQLVNRYEIVTTGG